MLNTGLTTLNRRGNWRIEVLSGATYTFMVVREVPPTLKVTVLASLLYWMSRF